MTGCPAVPSIISPAPDPGLPSNSALTRPLVGHSQLGEGSDGGGGVDFAGVGRAGVARGEDVAPAFVAPGGGVSRMTCPG